jgi:acetyltransferase-like isoleucine patch superfamily enzyme
MNPLPVLDKYNLPGVKMFEFTKIVGLENITFGRPVIVDDFAFVYAPTAMQIGSYVHIACFASVIGGAPLVLEDFVAISQGARILTGTDDFKDWGFGNSTVPGEFRNVRRAPIRVGKFSIVGANSTVLPGVTIGEGAMVGANSVVTRDLAPWGVYVGNHRISERNKAGVLDNYQRFLQATDATL